MHAYDKFLNPICAAETLDIFPAQRNILDSLLAHLDQFHGTVLDIGCGNMPYKPLLLAPPSRAKTYLGLDLRDSAYDPPDLEWDGERIPRDKGSIDCAIATEVFEHCPNPEVVMREAARVLKPGGFLFFTVPFLWPLHCTPHDEYRFTPFSLERHLRNAGFADVKMKALGGWDGSLAQMLGLWVRRRPLARRKRQLLSALALPIVRYLFNHDDRPEEFLDQTMITGVAGTATTPAGSEGTGITPVAPKEPNV